MNIRTCPFCNGDPEFDKKWSPFGFIITKIRFGCLNERCQFKPISEWIDVELMPGKSENLKTIEAKTTLVTEWNERPKL